MSVIIEHYHPNHHGNVVELITAIQQNEFNVSITYEDQPDLANIETFYDAFLVALYNHDVVGTVAVKRICDFAVIRKMFVKDTFRGKIFGIALALLQAIEHEIRLQQIKKIYISTPEFCKAAHRFYEKNGYEETSKDMFPSAFPIMTVDKKFYIKEL
jgi:N-acetylglutamate synthase-like GNAT family acetyltransferase